jgi:hypothetical protein
MTTTNTPETYGCPRGHLIRPTDAAGIATDLGPARTWCETCGAALIAPAGICNARNGADRCILAPEHDGPHANLARGTWPADPYDRAIQYARERGARDGANAAGWYIQDTIGGRARDPRNAARAILAGIENGDAAILDGFPTADLSGEWADTLTGLDLVTAAAEHAGLSSETEDEAAFEAFHAFYESAFVDICDAYAVVFDEASTDAIETAARDMLTED